MSVGHMFCFVLLGTCLVWLFLDVVGVGCYLDRCSVQECIALHSVHISFFMDHVRFSSRAILDAASAHDFSLFWSRFTSSRTFNGSRCIWTLLKFVSFGIFCISRCIDSCSKLSDVDVALCSILCLFAKLFFKSLTIKLIP